MELLTILRRDLSKQDKSLWHVGMEITCYIEPKIFSAAYTSAIILVPAGC